MKRLLAALGLALLTACGGGGGGGGDSTPPPPPAVGLVYTDPAGGGWRWTRNPALSTANRLVLDLQGPGPAASGRGVVFSLKADPALVAWSPVAAPGPALVQNLAVFNLGTGTALFKYSQQGGLLQAGIFQKGQGNAAALDGPVCRVVLAPASALSSGVQVALSAPNLQVLPESGAQLNQQPCAVGTLAAQ